MREIKFRAWDYETNSIIFPYMIDFNIKYAYYIDSKDECQRVGINTLMQYTGLKDKNGKEIYEGDFVKGEYTGYVYLVKYGHEIYIPVVGFYFSRKRQYNSSVPKEPVEVIGNIYENPELLKGNK